MPRLLSDTVEEPIQVLISSRQQEFAGVREELADLIPKIRMRNVRLFTVVLPENSSRNHITTEVDRLLKDSSIIIVLIGWDYSWWVDYEVSYAIRKGIPTLAYKYHVPRGRRRGATSPREATKPLLKRLKDADIKIRGDKGEYQSTDDLVSAIVKELPELVAMLVNNYADVNREIADGW